MSTLTTVSDSIAMQPLGANGGHGTRTSGHVSTTTTTISRHSFVSRIRSLGHPITRQSIAFFLFGLLNNSLYVVILTAALELIPKGTPTGLVAFFNIFPALLAKAIWPYVLKGAVRYTRRVWSCVAMNFVGLLIIALLPSLWLRLAGIGLASFSSGLGELTFLQLSTRFSRTGAGRGVAWFSSGTGAAGLIGASAWWIVRPLGVTGGLLSLSFLPLLMGFSYAVVLPEIHAVDEAEGDAKGGYEPLHAEAYDALGENDGDDDDNIDDVNVLPRIDGHQSHRISQSSLRSEEAVPLAISPHASSIGNVQGETIKGEASNVRLTLADKMALIRPMLFVYIVPLVLVYLFEYTINQGVAPTLLYPLPSRSNHPLLALIIKELKDYYPFYQLTYQSFVFLSRSSISIFRLPAIPKRFLWVPALLQGSLLAILISESLYSWFRASIASPVAIVLICVEGLAGGSAYVSVFYQIGTDESESTHKVGLVAAGQERHDVTEADESDQVTSAATAEIRRAQEHEFRIGCVGVGDTMGILVAALISMPLELALCDAQVRSGRNLCKEV